MSSIDCLKPQIMAGCSTGVVVLKARPCTPFFAHD